MRSFNGLKIEVGQRVGILQTPTNKGHRFLQGVVVELTPKQVVVKAPREHWSGSIKEDYLYSRYPHQIINNIVWGTL